ncbi:MAG: threonylcarbamoyl-AMP synthase, partial [Candidatus Fonsibacter lacus]|nr:threonylcarbamoyl-AMP synthase [Candidatus Fonsibacter lacus]
LKVDDGIAFIKDALPNSYDLIIVDGSDPVGPAEGLFSVSFYTNCFNALREGGISSEVIGKFLKMKLSDNKNKIIKSPGQIGLHYSPGMPIYMNREKATKEGALITFGNKNYSNQSTFNLSTRGSLKEAAKNFFNTLRIIKNKKFKSISVNKIPNKDLGKAINERLRRAAYYE